jgi:hypothetical protein
VIIVRTVSPLHPSVSYRFANDWQVGEDGRLDILKTGQPEGGATQFSCEPLGVHAPGTWEYVRVVDDES